jgi:hypothetical protein
MDIRAAFIEVGVLPEYMRQGLLNVAVLRLSMGITAERRKAGKSGIPPHREFANESRFQNR